jgi:hypothetical protein
MADQIRFPSIASGFVHYQNRWVEQTPYAVAQLSQVLEGRNQHLHLPVADIRSREEAETELRSYGLSSNSLELKCHRQQIDPQLEGDALRSVVDGWVVDLQQRFASSVALNPPVEEIEVNPGVSL